MTPTQPHKHTSDHADIAAVRLRDAVARLAANDNHGNPHRSFRRHVTHWWRTTREYGITDASALALAASLAEMAPTLGNTATYWDQLETLAAEAVSADGPARTKAVEAILTGLGIDPAITVWGEAQADWADMVGECGAMTSAGCAGHLAIHLRWTMAILVDGDTPTIARSPLVESALAGIAAVADQWSGSGDSVWAGLTHTAVVLDGQDTVARCASLMSALGDLDALAGGLR